MLNFPTFRYTAYLFDLDTGDLSKNQLLCYVISYTRIVGIQLRKNARFGKTKTLTPFVLAINPILIKKAFL